MKGDVVKLTVKISQSEFFTIVHKALPLVIKHLLKKQKKLLGNKANGRQAVSSEAGYDLKETQKL